MTRLLTCYHQLVSPVKAHLPRGDTDTIRLEGFADSSVTENIIHMGWFLDEPGMSDMGK